MAETSGNKSFWEHLDELRGSLIRILVVTFVFAMIAFCFKEWLFAVVLAPADASFFMYRWLGGGMTSLHLMNTGLTEHGAYRTIRHPPQDSLCFRHTAGFALYHQSALRLYQSGTI